MQKKIVGIIVCMLMIVSSISSVSGLVNDNKNSVEKLRNEKLTEPEIVNSDVNEWPMWRYDLQNTGYSTSSAPDIPKVLWTFESWCIHCTPAIVDDKVYIGSDEEIFFCLDADTGEYIWDYPIPGGTSIASPTVYEGKVYLGAVYDYIYCWDADTGKLIWKFYTGYGLKTSPYVVDGKVYIGTNGRGSQQLDAYLYCLDAETGEMIWDHNMGYNSISSSPAVYEGKVYIGSVNHMFYCLDADNGDLLWDYDTGSWVLAGPAVVDGKVYIGSGDLDSGFFFCLDADNGSKLWDFDTGGKVFSSAAIAYGNVYFVSSSVYCLDAETGDEKWNYTISNNWHDYSSPVVADGKVYVGIFKNGDLICLDAESGELIWQYPAATAGWLFSSPAVAYGRLYYGGGYKNRIYCFGEVPLLEVKNISGGLFRVKANVMNFGNAEATNVSYTISLEGGIIPFGRESTGTIPRIPIDGEVTIRSKFILGLGPVNISVTVAIPDESDTRTQSGFVYLLYVKVNPYEALQPRSYFKAETTIVRNLSEESPSESNFYKSSFPFELIGGSEI